MLDIFSLREGEFEIVDLDYTESRARLIRIFSLIKFGLGVDIVILIFAILFAYSIGTFSGWFILLIPILFAVVLLPSYRNIAEQLPSKVASLILQYNPSKELLSMLVRYWLKGKNDEFLEKHVRFNQAIGFKAIWFNDGLVKVDLLVDPNFPGTLIFETYDFFSLAELVILFEQALSKLDRWYYELEDGSEWSPDAKREINEEIQSAKIPWQIRDYFTTL